MASMTGDKNGKWHCKHHQEIYTPRPPCVCDNAWRKPVPRVGILWVDLWDIQGLRDEYPGLQKAGPRGYEWGTDNVWLK